MISFTKIARLIDLVKRTIEPVEIAVEDGIIVNIKSVSESECNSYILPGFIDAHVHIESSLLIPSEFARMATVHGTVGTISDPHEIANVLGIPGVEYMLQNAAKVPFHFFFGAPSCVPATAFETAGDCIDPQGVETLLKRDDIWYLAEVMNYPGVLAGDTDMMEKIAAAKRIGKPIDGHAPGLRGEMAYQYAAAGISTDHECFTLDEALDKIEAGMHILIREGSAARNFEALHPLLKSHPDRVMLCSDDKHPDNLFEGHIWSPPGISQCHCLLICSLDESSHVVLGNRDLPSKLLPDVLYPLLTLNNLGIQNYMGNFRCKVDMIWKEGQF